MGVLKSILLKVISEQIDAELIRKGDEKVQDQKRQRVRRRLLKGRKNKVKLKIIVLKNLGHIKLMNMCFLSLD